GNGSLRALHNDRSDRRSLKRTNSPERNVILDHIVTRRLQRVRLEDYLRDSDGQCVLSSRDAEKNVLVSGTSENQLLLGSQATRSCSSRNTVDSLAPQG